MAKARALVKEIYTISGDRRFARDFSLRDQIRRAALSIMLNIAEGFARRTNREFVQFLFIAHGSVAEVQAALYVALDQQYLTNGSFKDMYSSCDEISRMISGLIKYLGSK